MRRRHSDCTRANARAIQTDSLHGAPGHGSRAGSMRPRSPSTRPETSPRPQVSGHPCPLHSTRDAPGTPRLAVRSRVAPRTSARGDASNRVGPWRAARPGSRPSSRSARSRSASRERSRGDRRRGRTGSDERRARSSARNSTPLRARARRTTSRAFTPWPRARSCNSGPSLFRDRKCRPCRLSRSNSRQPSRRAQARNSAISDARSHHVRRKFFEALETAPVEAQQALDLVLAIYRIEQTATEHGIAGTEAHGTLREAFGRPAMARVLRFLRENRDVHPPRSPMGRAVRHAERSRLN